MAYADDFIAGGPDTNAGANYPSAFGIQFTPKVIGILVGLLGLGGAIYFFLNLVQPVVQKNDELKTQIQAEEEKITQPEVIEQRLKEANVKRDQAKRDKQVVLGLFANQQSLKTLLLDLNKRIENRNTAQPDDIKAKLKKFAPDTQASGVVSDTSLGASVQNQLYREVYNVELEGTFAQTMFSMVDIERLSTLLLVKNLKSELDTTDRFFVDVDNQGRLVPVKVNELPGGQPVTKLDAQGRPVRNSVRKLKTSFQLQALRPLTPEEQAKLQPPPAETKPAQ